MTDSESNLDDAGDLTPRRKRRRLYEAEPSNEDALESTEAAGDTPVYEVEVTEVKEREGEAESVSTLVAPVAAASEDAPPIQKGKVKRLPSDGGRSEQLARDREAAKIIERYALIGAGASALPLPFFDLVSTVGTQVLMVGELAQLHGLPHDAERARALIIGLVGGSATVLFGTVARSALKLIPGIGAALGFLAVPGSVAVFTHAVGLTFHAHFRSGRTLFNIDPERLKRDFERAQAARAAS